MLEGRPKKKEGIQRLRELLCVLEQEGSIGVGEVAARLHVSSATAAHYVSALRTADLIMQGREYVYDTKRDRKLRLRDDWHFSILSVGKQGLRTLSYCPATGACVRRSLSFCDAIPKEEALLADLSRVLATAKTERARGLLGVILEDGVALSDAAKQLLSDLPMASQEALMTESVLRVYPAESVLLVRYGDVPMMRLFSGGVPIGALRSEEEMRRAWKVQGDVRMAEMTKQVKRVLSLVIPDVVLLEADAVGVDAVAQALKNILGEECTKEDEARSRLVLPETISLCEREMLERLRITLAEQILSDEKTKNPPSKGDEGYVD